MINPVLVQVSRGGIAESLHRGAVCVVDADGAYLGALSLDRISSMLRHGYKT